MGRGVPLISAGESILLSHTNVKYCTDRESLTMPPVWLDVLEWINDKMPRAIRHPTDAEQSGKDARK